MPLPSFGGGGSQGGSIAVDLDGNSYIVSYPAITPELIMYWAIAVIIIIITIYLLLILASKIRKKRK